MIRKLDSTQQQNIFSSVEESKLNHFIFHHMSPLFLLHSGCGLIGYIELVYKNLFLSPVPQNNFGSTNSGSTTLLLLALTFTFLF